MLALLLVSQAFALDQSSLRSTSTYDLFRDPYDYLLLPGVMAAEDESALITLLNAYGDAGHFSAGGYGKLGPGVLGAVVDVGGAGSSSDAKETQKIVDAQAVTRSISTASSSSWGAILSYGMPLSDTLAFGAALRVEQDASTLSFDPSSGTVGGANTEIDISDGDDTKSEGSAGYLDRSLEALVGGALFSDSGYMSLDVGLAMTTVSSQVSGTWEYVDSTITYKGYVPGTAFAENRAGLGPVARFEMVRAVGEITDLRVTADLGMAAGEPARLSSSSTTTATDTSYTQTETLKNATWRSSSYGVLAALHVEAEDLSVRPGLRLRRGSYGEAYTLESSYESVYGETTDEGSAEYDASLERGFLTLGLPIAVEVPLGQEERWTMRLAGDWAWTRTTVVDGTFYEDEEAEASDRTETTTTSASSAGSAALGLRFQPVDALRLDAAAYGGTSYGGGSNEAVSIGSVWLSATLLLQ